MLYSKIVGGAMVAPNESHVVFLKERLETGLLS